MRKAIIATSVFGLAVFGVAASLNGASHRDYQFEDREAVRHTFAGNLSLDVDEVNGWIHVTGDGGNTIRVEGERVIRAASQEEITRAKHEVTLDINEKDGIAQLYVNGPFRDSNHASENHGFHEHRDREYEVTYNFTIHLPRATAVRLRTVNGEISSQDTTGKFDVKTINGGISMAHIAGSGTVDTLNGSTVVSFRENPKANSYFKSFNGRVEVTFEPNLSADLGLKTFNGHAYTDFDVIALAGAPGTAERRDGKFVYKSNDSRTVRVGSGGPELKFETFNGDIHIRKAQ